MYDTCIASVVDECPDAVSDESLDRFKVLDLRSRSSWFEEWCISKMFWLDGDWEFLPRWKVKKLRETSAEIRGSLVEWKDKTESLAQKRKGPEEF